MPEPTFEVIGVALGAVSIICSLLGVRMFLGRGGSRSGSGRTDKTAARLGLGFLLATIGFAVSYFAESTLGQWLNGVGMAAGFAAFAGLAAFICGLFLRAFIFRK